jgi:hypothetical protein
VNPYHTDEVFASATPFKRRIVPGLLTASLLSHLGGLWAFLATEMQFEFLAPVYVGDTITAEAEIEKLVLMPNPTNLDLSQSTLMGVGGLMINFSLGTVANAAAMLSNKT